VNFIRYWPPSRRVLRAICKWLRGSARERMLEFLYPADSVIGFRAKGIL
jgi:hypothetical protein